MSRSRCLAAPFWAGFLLATGMLRAAETPPPAGSPAAKPADVAGKDAAGAPRNEAAAQAQREKEFAETMTGATLCGQFTAESLSAAPCKDGKSSGAARAADGKQSEQKAENAAQRGSDTNGGTSGDKQPSANVAAKPLREDRYTLGRVQKLQGDRWLIEARIQYGDHDLTVPLPLTVKWAGDTPVVTLTDLSVPGLGMFTARVLFYQGQYAGTWSHGDHGGQLFGRIAPAKK